jgi:hypothetical protein
MEANPAYVFRCPACGRANRPGAFMCDCGTSLLGVRATAVGAAAGAPTIDAAATGAPAIDTAWARAPTIEAAVAGERTYYEVLGIDPGVDHAEVIRAFGRVSSPLHPSKDPGPDAARRLAEATDAYRVLSDPTKRLAYDSELPLNATHARELAELTLLRDSERTSAAAERGGAIRDIRGAKAAAGSAFAIGALLAGGGGIATWVTYTMASGGSYYIVFWGAIVFGVYRMLRAAYAYLQLWQLERS